MTNPLDYKRVYLDFLGCWTDKGNAGKCVFCERAVKSTLYYPQQHELNEAPEGTPREYIKVCKSHYDMGKTIMNKATMPVTLEALRLRFTAKKSGSNSHTELRGWLFSPEHPTSVWYGTRTVPTNDFNRFQDWVINEKVRFAGREERVSMLSEFVTRNPDIDPKSLVLFEEYLQGS